MVHVGIANSQMKDFIDVWFLAQTFSGSRSRGGARAVCVAGDDSGLRRVS